MEQLGDFHLAAILKHLDISSCLNLSNTCSGYHSVCQELMSPLFKKLYPLIKKSGVANTLRHLTSCGGKGTKEHISLLVSLYPSAPATPTKLVQVNFTGHPGAGVTSFIMRWITGDFSTTPNTKFKLQACGVYSLVLDTNKGVYHLLLYSEKAYQCPQPDATIFFATPGQLPKEEELPQTRTVVCNSHSDTYGNAPVAAWSFLMKRKALGVCTCYYQVSARSNYNFEKPFLQVLRWYAGDETLTLT